MSKLTRFPPLPKHLNGNRGIVSSAFRKETIRSITHSLGRFLAIAAIVALGTGFYAGLRMTAPDMKQAADEYFDGTALMDVRVISTLGLTDADIAALRQVEGVEAVMPARETDVMATIAGEQYATRVHSLPDAARKSDTSDKVHALSDNPNYLNRPILIEGSWPQKTGECVLSADLASNGSRHVGDTVTITEGLQDVDETLTTRTYTIVGYVNAPYYATSSSMGTTTLGSGAIQEFMYVPEDDFSSDLPYTEAFLTVRGAAAERSSSEAYDNQVAEVVTRIESLAPEREVARVDELKGDAQKELDEQRAEFERQKTDAESQLADAQQQLDEAAATLAESEQKLASGQTDYDNGAAELVRQRTSAQQQLADAQQQLVESQQKLDATRADIEQLEASLPALQAQWQAGADELASQLAQWQQNSDGVDAGIVQAEQGVAQLTQGIADANAQLVAIPAQIAGLEQQLAQATDEAEKAQLQAQIAALRAAAAALPPTIAGLEAQLGEVNVTLQGLQDTRVQLDQAYQNLIVPAQAKVDEGKASLDQAQAGRDEFRAGESQLAAGWAQYDASKQQADSQITAAQQQLDAAAAQLQSGRNQLTQGKADYQSGLDEYYQRKSEADEKLADAQSKLDDAQQQINKLATPEWLVMDRSANYGVTSFNSDADRVDSIAQVFPFIFFLVAALVALTTMTRMVEEERVLIGTFKALGYHRMRIASKYLIYAAIASGAGSLLGIGVLSQVLPMVIMNAYGIIYFVPAMTFPIPIDPWLTCLSAGLGVGVTLFATWAAATATLRERPALLMLPRAPKAGKRILLERISPVWRHLSFSWKVTFRNLFRYKKRFIMTVIGIAGCTALLLTGLGLSNAINDIIDKQFSEITKYNTSIALDDTITNEDRAAAESILDEDRFASGHTLVLRQNMLVQGPAKKDTHTEVMVVEEPESFGDFFTLRTRVGHTPVPLAPDGLVLTEKLANELGVNVGDTVTLIEQDAIGNATNTSYDATVTGIVENYIYHTVFVGPTLYERLLGESPAYNTVLARATTDSEARIELGDKLRAVDGVKTVAYNDETIGAYRDMMSSVNMIVIVLVVAAAALAFIVLYNLTNINITERMREIATLKVLGFTPREMNAYIFRETFLLAAIGCAVGLVLGVWMEGFVVVTAEVNQVMFGREIHVMSFVAAFVLTMLFTLLVMLAMRGKLHRIDMVESLKSNE